MKNIKFSSTTSDYIWVRQRMTYEDAQTFAEGKGGTLVAINSKKENSLIFNTLSDKFDPATSPAQLGTAADGGGSVFVWLGGNDMATEGVFVWDSGDAFNFTRFGSGDLGSEPDNFNGTQDALAMGLENWPNGAARA